MSKLRLSRHSITYKICATILVVETVLLGLMGGYYVIRFGQEIDASIAEKMSLPALLMGQRALTFDSVNDFSVLEDLIQEKVEDAFIAKKNGDIFYSVETERIGRHVLEFLEGEEKELWSPDVADNQFVSYTDSARKKYKSVFSPIIVNNKVLGLLYIKIRSETIQQRKNDILYLFLAGALLTIILTSVLEAYLVRTIIVPRLKNMLDVTRQVKNRDFAARIPRKGPPDELDELIGQVNSMIVDIESNIELLRILHRSGEYLSQAVSKKDFVGAVITIFSQYLKITLSKDDRREISEKLQTFKFRPEEQFEVVKIFEPYGLDTIDPAAREFSFALYEKIVNAMERQEGIQALKEAEENYRSLFSFAVEGIFRVDLSGKVLEANPSMASMMGYASPEDMVNSCNNVIDHYADTQDRSRLLGLLEKNGHVNDFEALMIRKNGSTFYASITAHALTNSQGNLIGSEGRLLDVSERHNRQQAELEKERALAAEKAAELASKAKSEFLANMSHELRTPLNSILGFTQILARDNVDSSQEETLKIIERSGNHLLNLINQILDFSKIEADCVSIEENNLDLFHLLDELENMMSIRALGKELELLVSVSPEVPRIVRTDEIKLRQILINLLSNAIKFTEAGFVKIYVGILEKGNEEIATKEKRKSLVSSLNKKCYLCFEITDTGVGVDQEEVGNIFEPFGQARNGRLERDGTGLGLVICKKFVELLGGELQLKSTAGKGSTFSFYIPVKVVDDQDISTRKIGSQVINSQHTLSHYRMLVVDDKWDNRKLLVSLLTPLGFEVQEIQNGQQALDAFNRWKPHMIWMDLRMPGMDGYEAARKIRENANQELQPVIVAVTANVLHHQDEQARDAGFDDLIVKPFHVGQVYEMIEKHLNVTFVYESIERSLGQTELIKRKSDFSLADFSDLPQDMVASFRKSINALQLHTALDILDKISVENETLADELRECVKNYRFDLIQEILEQK